jgi:glycerophosphoryl diester phosphodiesterase
VKNQLLTTRGGIQVWLTLDDELIVVHGGDSGEINLHDQSTKLDKNYIFECTLEENRVFEKKFQLPSLQQVIELLDKQVFMNIEMKVPYLEDQRRKYDWHKAVRKLHSVIQEYELKDYCFVSSFFHPALREIELVSHSEFYKVRTIYLQNFYNQIGLPPLDELLTMGDGVNIEY